ncbi:MAG TPA: hypothetical protein VGV39_27420 [Mesorhizobium sp.]|uniref:hypothetical protein n=1 Tax=Mesorhizobium sp. TaxID=1871066 RepID=UPI002DDC966E|nr:hypothetical protein [Mesorhizobium sp.]HEV2506832.1 hypothetical protein [Mesorhizobium sp.]
MISLPVLVMMVVVGISMAVAAVHFTGGSRVTQLIDAGQALDRFAEDFPDLKPEAVQLTENGDTAFIELGDGRTGIVHAIGDRFLTRIVTPAEIEFAGLDDGNFLTLRFKDFTWRGGRFAFADATTADAVFKALDPNNHPARQEAA